MPSLSLEASLSSWLRHLEQYVEETNGFHYCVYYGLCFNSVERAAYVPLDTDVRGLIILVH